MGEMISDESAYIQAFWAFLLFSIAYIKLVIVEIALNSIYVCILMLPFASEGGGYPTAQSP